MFAILIYTQTISSFKFSIASSTISSIHTNRKSDIDKLSISKLNVNERLQKVIARSGITSRRKAEKLILDGCVTVNGNVIDELGAKVTPESDIIKVNGKKVEILHGSDLTWMILNKPKGVLTTTSDDRERQTLWDLVPKARSLRLYPVGRLERIASGLLLMTNDISWIHPLTHPSYLVRKGFQVIINGLPTLAMIQDMASGMHFPGEKTKCLPCSVTVLDVDKKNKITALDIQLHEVRFNHISLMMEQFGLSVVRMKRTDFGALHLSQLTIGQSRHLTPIEVLKLKNSCKLRTS